VVLEKLGPVEIIRHGSGDEVRAAAETRSDRYDTRSRSGSHWIHRHRFFSPVVPAWPSKSKASDSMIVSRNAPSYIPVPRLNVSMSVTSYRCTKSRQQEADGIEMLTSSLTGPSGGLPTSVMYDLVEYLSYFSSVFQAFLICAVSPDLIAV
jgi:hypothetical protein